MSNNTTTSIITIGREYGSGGRVIGQEVAKYFGIKCYDKELLARAAKDSGLCEEVFEHHDEVPTNSFLYNLVMDTYSFGYNSSAYVDMPVSHKVFLAQFDTIKKLADEEPCVIVGRCADYALQGRDNLIRIFISGDEDVKIKHVMERFGITEQQAKEMCTKKDKQRRSYYDYYSSKKWGNVNTYDLAVNSSVLGIDGTAEFIIQYVNDVEKRRA